MCNKIAGTEECHVEQMWMRLWCVRGPAWAKGSPGAIPPLTGLAGAKEALVLVHRRVRGLGIAVALAA
jgi:hypothetical protein